VGVGVGVGEGEGEGVGVGEGAGGWIATQVGLPNPVAKMVDSPSEPEVVQPDQFSLTALEREELGTSSNVTRNNSKHRPDPLGRKL
jgi:hypothetical protein